MNEPTFGEVSYPSKYIGKRIRVEKDSGRLVTGTLEAIQEYRGKVILLLNVGGEELIAINFDHVVEIQTTGTVNRSI